MNGVSGDSREWKGSAEDEPRWRECGAYGEFFGFIRSFKFSGSYLQTIHVPVGVEIVNEDTGRLIVESIREFQKILLLRGGEGAMKSNAFM